MLSDYKYSGLKHTKMNESNTTTMTQQKFEPKNSQNQISIFFFIPSIHSEKLK